MNESPVVVYVRCPKCKSKQCMSLVEKTQDGNLIETIACDCGHHDSGPASSFNPLGIVILGR